jgi:hypothetical protein
MGEEEPMSEHEKSITANKFETTGKLSALKQSEDLDRALADTFPASDPVSMLQPSQTGAPDPLSRRKPAEKKP